MTGFTLLIISTVSTLEEILCSPVRKQQIARARLRDIIRTPRFWAIGKILSRDRTVFPRGGQPQFLEGKPTPCGAEFSWGLNFLTKLTYIGVYECLQSSRHDSLCDPILDGSAAKPAPNLECFHIPHAIATNQYHCGIYRRCFTRE